MVLGAARHMGGCNDALIQLWRCRQLCSPRSTSDTTAAVYIFVWPIEVPPLLGDSP
jgi:hypothetical protein